MQGDHLPQARVEHRTARTAALGRCAVVHAPDAGNLRIAGRRPYDRAVRCPGTNASSSARMTDHTDRAVVDDKNAAGSAAARLRSLACWGRSRLGRAGRPVNPEHRCDVARRPIDCFERRLRVGGHCRRTSPRSLTTENPSATAARGGSRRDLRTDEKARADGCQPTTAATNPRRCRFFYH